ncbi:MAG: hypothetical protein ACON38_16060, partial [Akkermansiaceae bacterium]
FDTLEFSFSHIIFKTFVSDIRFLQVWQYFGYTKLKVSEGSRRELPLSASRIRQASRFLLLLRLVITNRVLTPKP